jgi:hypothetical protein
LACRNCRRHRSVQDRVDSGSIPHRRQSLAGYVFECSLRLRLLVLGCSYLFSCWLLLRAFVRLFGDILFFCRRVILIVARDGFGNLFRRKLAVIFGMQYVAERTGIRGHGLRAP